VLDQDDPDPLLPDEPPDHAEELLADGGRQADGRLVQQEERRARGERADDLDHPLLAARQGPRGLVGDVPDPHQVEELPGPGRGGPLGGTGARQPEEDPEEAARHLRVEAGQHVLERGQLVEEPSVLERPSHALRRHQVRREAVDPLAAEVDRPRGQRRMPRDRVEQRRLAGPVRPDDRPHLARLEPERHPGDRGEPSVAHGDVGQLEERHRYSR
jgi:hypothetical protein